MVKAGALGDTHVKSWDRTWSSSDSKEVHIVRRWSSYFATAILCGWHRPNLGGQDGRVVKAGALGDTHVKSWDRTWSSSDFKEVHIVRRWSS